MTEITNTVTEIVSTEVVATEITSIEVNAIQLVPSELVTNAKDTTIQANYCLIPIECCNMNANVKSFHHRNVGITGCFCCSPAVTLASMSCIGIPLGSLLLYTMIGLGATGSSLFYYASNYNISHCMNPFFLLNLIREED
jgi:hypothetical protein